MFYLVTLLGMAALIAVDQLTKTAAVAALSDGPFVLIPGVFQLNLTYNTGAAFSLAEGKRTGLLVVTTAALLALAFALFTRRISKSHWVTTGCVLALSGGVGNWIDRLFRHKVTDFLDFNLINFPIFNMADVFVVSGAIVLLVYFLFVYREPAAPDGAAKKLTAAYSAGSGGESEEPAAPAAGTENAPGEGALQNEHGEANTDASAGQDGREN